jgi:hypothetical protein
LSWEVIFYSLPSGKQPVLSWLAEQAPEVRAAFAHLFELLESHGTTMGQLYANSLGKTPKAELDKAQKRMADYLSTDPTPCDERCC